MVLIITFIVTMIVGVPICYVLGLVGAAGLVSMGPTYFSTVAQKLFASANNYSLMAIPMFILAGELMGLSGDVHRLMDFCRSIIGRIRGGIAYVCTIVGLLLGGILGMANAEAALLSSTIYPEMLKDGYEDTFSACFIGSVSVVGPLIPPGLLYVIYGVASGTPIASLFESGVIPGILVAIALMSVIFVLSRKPGCPWKTHEVGGVSGGGVIEESLRSSAELSAVLSDEDEGALDNVAAVLDGVLGRGDAADGQSLYVVLKSCEGSVADGVRVRGDGGDNVTGGGQLLTVLAGVLGVGDGLEAVAGAAAGLTADEDDLGVIAADFLPVGDLAGVDLRNGLNVEVGDGVCRVHDNGDAVEGKDGLLEAGGLLIVLQRAGGQANVAAAFGHGGDAGAGAGRVIGEGHALVLLHEGFAQCADDLLHGGGAVGRDGAAQLCGSFGSGSGRGSRGSGAAAACQKRQCKDCNKCYTDDLFHFSFLLLFFQYENTHFFFVVFHATAIIIASPRKMKNRAHVKYM